METAVKKAITLRPYWAWAVCHAGKRIENRTWATKYRGPLAIHAGLGNKKTDAADRAALEALGIEPPPAEELVRGAVVAECKLVDCLRKGEGGRGKGEKTLGAIFESDRLISLAADKFACGPFCWVLENVQTLNTPIPLKGRLGLFGIP